MIEIASGRSVASQRVHVATIGRNTSGHTVKRVGIKYAPMSALLSWASPQKNNRLVACWFWPGKSSRWCHQHQRDFRAPPRYAGCCSIACCTSTCLIGIEFFLVAVISAIVDAIANRTKSFGLTRIFRADAISAPRNSFVNRKFNCCVSIMFCTYRILTTAP